MRSTIETISLLLLILVFIPMAAVIYANFLNAVNLEVERFHAEFDRGQKYAQSRNAGLHAALIPLTNSMFAVGLVTLPGMMTGQILSDVDYLISARYQIMIMAMILGSAGISVIVFYTF